MAQTGKFFEDIIVSHLGVLMNNLLTPMKNCAVWGGGGTVSEIRSQTIYIELKKPQTTMKKQQQLSISESLAVAFGNCLMPPPEQIHRGVELLLIH